MEAISVTKCSRMISSEPAAIPKTRNIVNKTKAHYQVKIEGKPIKNIDYYAYLFIVYRQGKSDG